jgi:lipopolysaccharide/colanic/teichoic acid biosynthesis glycosyltransferase
VVKRLLDLAVAGGATLLLLPSIGLIALLIKREDDGPVLYNGTRVGKDGKLFKMHKFRTMVPNADQIGGPSTAGDDPRLTRIGRRLRKYKLDELPQLFNVLKGEMSLVGPRPERPAFVDVFVQNVYRYGDRHRVKSGMTGWAQIHGLRGKTSLSDRVEWDNYYIENWSLWLDVKILLLTATAVLRSRKVVE